MLFAESILKLLFPNASMGANLLKISSLAIVFMILSQTLSAILQGIGKVNTPFMAMGIGTIIKLICNILLIQNEKIGIYGAVIGNIICNIIAVIIEYYILNKKIRLKLSIKQFWIKPLIAAVIMGIFAMYINKCLNTIFIENICTIITLVSAIIIYVILIFVLRIINIEDLKMC